MPVTMKGETYYRTAEVYRVLGVSRTTLYRWLKNGIFGEARYRDRRGWRLFTEHEVERMKAEANRIIEVSHLKTTKGSP